MIRTRFGVAAAVLISIAALALGIVAFMSTVRDDSPTVGRMVQTRLTNEYTGPFVSFPLDEFWIGPGHDGRLHAFYAYPPGYYGHMRGCKVVWDNAATLDVADGTFGPGLFLDPCGGARFTRQGELVGGPADRGLDYFETSAGVEGTFVDTRTLRCGLTPGAASPPPAMTNTPAPSETRTATAAAGGTATATRTVGASATPTASATRTATPTTTPTPSETATGTPASLTCPRVTANTP